MGIIMVERLTARDVDLPLTAPAGALAGEKAEADARRRRGVMNLFMVWVWCGERKDEFGPLFLLKPTPSVECSA